MPTGRGADDVVLCFRSHPKESLLLVEGAFQDRQTGRQAKHAPSLSLITPALFKNVLWRWGQRGPWLGSLGWQGFFVEVGCLDFQHYANDKWGNALLAHC